MKRNKRSRARIPASTRPAAAARRPVTGVRVFLSWSGEESRQVAVALRDWLPQVIQSLEPWMSELDIDAGARWFEAISAELEKASAGIICLTPSNMDRVWLNFEAGAIAKHVSDSRTCPYLFRLKWPQVTGPLRQFQAVAADLDGTRKLMRTLNRLTDRPVERLDEAVDTWWPKLTEKLGAIPAGDAPPPVREPTDMLEEVLLTVRDLARESQRAAKARAQAAFLRGSLMGTSERLGYMMGTPERLGSRGQLKNLRDLMEWNLSGKLDTAALKSAGRPEDWDFDLVLNVPSTKGELPQTKDPAETKKKDPKG